MLKLNDLLHVPNITRNLIAYYKLAKDNKVFLEFHSNKCFVKSQTSNLVLIKGFLAESHLYCFTNIALEYLKNILSHKSHSLSLVVIKILVANMYTRCQCQNKSVGNNFIAI